MEEILAFIVEVSRFLGRYILRALQLKDVSEFLEIATGLFIIIVSLSLIGWLVWGV